MKNRDFKRLNAKKDAQTIKEEFMIGKHNKLTPKQLETVCKNSRDGGGICFGKNMTVEEMENVKNRLEQNKQNKKNVFDKIADWFR